MNLWLIIPVKPFPEGKSRLACALPNATRTDLSRQLFHHVLLQSMAAPVLAGIVVVSRDPAVLDGLISPRLHFVAERGNELNQAIQQGRQEAVRHDADAILVLPADLPRLQSSDIVMLYEHAVQREGLVIVPSDDNGTNALLLRPPQAINFAFGHNSFAHHCLAAQLVDLPCTIVDSPHLSFDLDRPHDLALLRGDPLFAPYTSASSPQAWR